MRCCGRWEVVINRGMLGRGKRLAEGLWISYLVDILGKSCKLGYLLGLMFWRDLVQWSWSSKCRSSSGTYILLSRVSMTWCTSRSSPVVWNWQGIRSASSPVKSKGRKLAINVHGWSVLCSHELISKTSPLNLWVDLWTPFAVVVFGKSSSFWHQFISNFKGMGPTFRRTLMSKTRGTKERSEHGRGASIQISICSHGLKHSDPA